MARQEKSFGSRGIPVGDPRGYEFVGPGWGWAQNAPFRRHKVWTYEGGIATPLVAHWPAGIAKEGEAFRMTKEGPLHERILHKHVLR